MTLLIYHNILFLYINFIVVYWIYGLKSSTPCEDKNKSKIECGELWFNGKQLLGVRSGVLDDNQYQNIATYKNDSISHSEHYNLYIGKPSSIAAGSSIALTEESIDTYSRDRIVLQIL